MVWFSQWSHGQPWVWAVGVVILLMIHEIGHIAAAYIYGGQWLGFQGTFWGIGVRLDLSSSPPPARWRTLVAGPLAEWLAIVTAGSLWSSDWRVWICLGLTNALLNVVPWGVIPNDGTQLLRYWTEARKSPRYRLLHRS